MPTLLSRGPFPASASRNRRGLLTPIYSNFKGFLPNTISGLILWLKSDTITGLADNAAVSSWSDSSGNSNTASQGTGAVQPIYKTNIRNGLPAVRFDGAGDYMTLASNITAAPLTIFIVASRTSGTSYRHLLDLQKVFVLSTPGSGSNWAVYVNAEPDSGQSLTSTPKVISAVVRNYNDIDMLTNGANSVTRTTGTGYMSGASSMVGGDGGGSSHTGDIFEILVYNSALSSVNRALVETHLMQKYAL